MRLTLLMAVMMRLAKSSPESRLLAARSPYINTKRKGSEERVEERLTWLAVLSTWVLMLAGSDNLDGPYC